MLAGGAARAGVVSPWDGTGSNDSTSWAGLGADGTTIPAAFSATSTLGIAVSGSFAGSSGLVAVQCPAAACSWTGGFGAGDSLVWAFDNTNTIGSGPLTLGLGTAVLAGGVEIQADASGMFDAQVEAFDGITPLGTTSLSSDVAGDPVFIGIQDTVAEITSLVFSLTSCSGDCNDFAVDTLLLIELDRSTAAGARACVDVSARERVAAHGPHGPGVGAETPQNRGDRDRPRRGCHLVGLGSGFPANRGALRGRPSIDRVAGAVVGSGGGSTAPLDLGPAGGQAR